MCNWKTAREHSSGGYTYVTAKITRPHYEKIYDTETIGYLLMNNN